MSMVTGDFDLPFIQARHYQAANRNLLDIKWIILHAMQAPEKPTTAEGTANYFKTTDVVASAHFNHDVDSTVQSVLLKDIAYGAPRANRFGVHCEHAGFSEQSASDWTDPYSIRMITEQVAPTVRKVIDAAQMPIRFCDAAALNRGERGITTHAECSKAFGGDHWDPGPYYPIDLLLDAVRGDNEMTPEQDQLLRDLHTQMSTDKGKIDTAIQTTLKCTEAVLSAVGAVDAGGQPINIGAIADAVATEMSERLQG